MPNFTLPRSNGVEVSMREALLPLGLVIVFVHGTYCPLCLTQLQRLNRVAGDLAMRDIGLLAISPDSAGTIYGFEAVARPPLAYPILVDSSPSVAIQFGIFDILNESPLGALYFANGQTIVRYRDVSANPDFHPDIDGLMAHLRQTDARGADGAARKLD